MRAILDPEDVKRMEIALTKRDERFGLLWRLGVTTGLRVSDLLRLKKGDLRRSPLCVVEQKSGKTKKIDIDTVTWLGIEWFLQGNPHMRDEDYVFYRRALGGGRFFPMSRQWVRTVIAITAHEMGLESIGAHSMRKIYACDRYRATGSLEAVRAALNHSKIETTMIYLRDILSA